MDTRHPSIARASDSLLVIVDCQERLWKVIHEAGDLVAPIAALALGAARLGVPVVVTEQYPKGLGPTVAEISKAAAGASVLEKTTFSCFGCQPLREVLRGTERGTLVVCGIEGHVCVQQSVLDGLAEGYQVQVVVDAVGSRNPIHRDVALRRLERAGAVLTTSESVLFDWLERCDHEAFKDIQGLIR
jgi:nicotinamidase-related amidase